jgi:hypothetical protein
LDIKFRSIVDLLLVIIVALFIVFIYDSTYRAVFLDQVLIGYQLQIVNRYLFQVVNIGEDRSPVSALCMCAG